MELFPRRIFDDSLFDFVPTRMDSTMKCDIYEKEGNYHIEMDLPGYKKEDISIETSDGYLTIKAEKKSEINEEDTERNYIRRERTYGTYERSFSLGDLDQKNIDATFNNGILSIVVPKKAEEKKNYIEIK